MTINFGMKAWGVITALLAGCALVLIVYVGIRMGLQGGTEVVTSLGVIGGIYRAVTDNNTLLAGVIGFSGLAWVHFFNAVVAGETREADAKIRPVRQRDR